jgi:hypothetical protein
MRYRRDRPPVPTLGQLRTQTCWLWLCCLNGQRCWHSAPAALAPFLIRWGASASSDTLRRSVRCGSKGATLRHPSWKDSETGVWPFPADRLEARVHRLPMSGH